MRALEWCDFMVGRAGASHSDHELFESILLFLE